MSEPVWLHPNRLVRRLLANAWFEPGPVFAISFVLYVFVPAVWALRNGTLVSDRIDAFLSPPNSYVFAIPFVFAAIVAYFRDTSDLLDKLVGSKTLECDAPALRKAVANVEGALWSRVLSAVFLTVLVAAPLVFLLNRQHAKDVTWLFSTPNTPRPVAFYYVPLFHGLGVYIFLSWVLLHLRASAVLRKLFRPGSGCQLHLSILHPDKCMGLGPIGDMVKSVATVLIALSFLFFMWQAGEYYSHLPKGVTPLAGLWTDLAEIQTGAGHILDLPRVGMLLTWFAFCFFSPLVFFAPLTSAKQAMASLKKATLLELGAKIVDSPGLDHAQLYRYYRQVQKARVWPFNTQTISSFVATLGSPVVVAVLTEIIKHYLKST